jgi:hypothetical protein
MTAAEQQTVNMLLEVVKANAKANDEAHADIVDRIGTLADSVAKANAETKEHCDKREETVNAAIAEVKSQPTKFEMSARTIGKFLAVSLTEITAVLVILHYLGIAV